MTVVYFILLLGGLIFFHELGHFLVARLMGVHVVTFSIGFGPTLFKIKGRQKREGVPPTEYVIAALPLGGYVRMLGDDPTEDLPDQMRGVSFNHKPVWRRFLIVAAGPVFNLVLPYLIYVGVGFGTAQLTPSWIGMVDADGPAATAGMKPGDRIVSIAGEDVDYWWQVRKLVSERPGETVTVEVARDGHDQPVALEMTTKSVREQLLPGLDAFDEEGRIGVAPVYVKPFVAVVEDSPLWEAGVRTGDRVAALDGEPVERLDQVLTRLDEAAAPVRVDYVRYGFRASPDNPTDLVVAQPGSAEVPARDAGDIHARGAASHDCVVEEVLKNSPAEEIGLNVGDVVLSLDGAPCRNWGFLASSLKQAPDQHHSLTWAHGGEVRTESRETWIASVVDPAPTDPDRTVQAFGVRTRSGMYGIPDMIPNEHRASYALVQSVDRTHAAVRMNVLAIAGLFTGEVPMTELSGPVGIFQLTSQTSDRGWSHFFALMVWLSISLGLINLLPIPVLDGGHIVFLAIEAVRRRPVSLRTRQIATYVGLAIIILLMVIGFKNDLQRPWG
ncbi:MAG: site-2 protease family protein [Myxococcota bacterium]